MERLEPGGSGACSRPRCCGRRPTLDLTHVTPVRYTVAEAMSTLEERIGTIGTGATFRDLVADCEERIQVVVRFLAILELYREGKVELAQAETFGEIEVAWSR